MPDGVEQIVEIRNVKNYNVIAWIKLSIHKKERETILIAGSIFPQSFPIHQNETAFVSLLKNNFKRKKRYRLTDEARGGSCIEATAPSK